MFWDGLRWVDERAAPTTGSHTSSTTRRKPRRWLLVGAVAVGIVALALPSPDSAAARYGATELTTAWNVEYSTQMLQETAPRVTTRGAWNRVRHPQLIGGRAVNAVRRGARLSVTFKGTGIALVGPRSDRRGSARIYVDGRRVKTVSAYAEKYQAKQTLFVATWDSVKTRTVTVEILGTKGHPVFTVDSFVVRGPKKPKGGEVTPPSPTPTPTPPAAPTAVPTAKPTAVPTPTPTPAPTPSATVRVTSIPALLSALANNAVTEIVVANGTYRVSPAGSMASNSLWIGARFAGRTNPVTVRAETTGGVTFTGADTERFGGITFVDGAHHQTWDGFRWANAKSSAGVIFFGGELGLPAPHHITLRNITVPASVTSDRPNLNHMVYFSWAAGGVHDILIDGLTADGAGGMESAIHFYHSEAGNPNAWNVTIRNVQAVNFDQAFIVWDATLSNIVIEDSTVTNSGRFAVRYEVGGTLILRRVTSTGSAQGGFYSSLGANPPGVTFVNNSFR